jgi:hypothetical protein
LEDITWEANYARMIIGRYETMVAAIAAFAEQSDFCVVCGEHPSHDHGGKDCFMKIS